MPTTRLNGPALSTTNTGINLTPDMIPKEVRILKFEPGHIMRFLIPLSLMHRSENLMLSLTIYYIILHAIFSIVAKFVQFPALFRLMIDVAVLALCAFFTRRGVVVSILLAKKKYRVISLLSWVPIWRVPYVKVRTRKLGNVWVSKLYFGGYHLATNLSDVDLASADGPFRNFVLAFSPKENNLPRISRRVFSKLPTFFSSGYHSLHRRIFFNRLEGIRPKLTKQLATDLPCDEIACSTLSTIRPEACRSPSCPLVLLVHGTWGRKSAWVVPERSSLVKALRSRLTTDIEYRKFPWSGVNQPRARLTAASQLTEVIQSELLTQNRTIFILAHSHGGNIADRAINSLSTEQRPQVCSVLMGTPFLIAGHRFGIGRIYSVLPHYVYENFESLWTLGFLFAVGWSFVQASALLGIRWADHDRAIDWLSAWPLILLAWPLILFVITRWTWRKGATAFSDLLQTSTSDDKTTDIKHTSGRSLVITYSHDEAFQGLSFVINCISIVHQLVFLGIYALTAIIAKLRLSDIIGNGLELLFGASLFITLASLDVLFVLNDVLPNKFDVAIMLEHFLNDLPSGDSMPDVYVYPLMYVFLGYFSLAIAIQLCIGSILITGAIRLCIFYAIGVMEQIQGRNNFLNSVLGSVSISMIPKGASHSVLLTGQSLFNHVRIYDDERTIAEIVRFMEDTFRPPG
jgi:hypothetical protein